MYDFACNNQGLSTTILPQTTALCLMGEYHG
ncbi:MAG: hypothetical protein ACJAZW_000780 [Maritalea sp.]|jgi:hypothetical protein